MEARGVHEAMRGGGRPAGARRGLAGAFLMMLALTLTSACGDGDDGDGGGATPTPTVSVRRSPTATAPPATPTQTAARTLPPTATPTPGAAARVVGLAVLGRNIVARGDDALGAPPEAWMAARANATYDRSLAFADWAVAEDPSLRGTTGTDGQFEIADIPAGRYTLVLSKTVNGNLLSARVPFGVGPSGATLVAEISWGRVRSVSSYTEDGVEVREVRDPYGRWLITRGGRVAELGDGTLNLSDPDGDGLFDVLPCPERLWSCAPDKLCEEGRACGCTTACRFCENCGPLVCQPSGLFPPPDECDDRGGCENPSDRCACVSSCAECDDCLFRVCVPECSAVQITGLSVNGFPPQLIVGQSGQVHAIAVLSDQRQIDVTTLVDWQSSNEEVATVDSFGVVATYAVGTAAIRAALGNLSSEPWQLEVQARPPLRRIHVQNVNCYYPYGIAVERPVTQPPVLVAPVCDGIWCPVCNQVVQIGGTIQFNAVGEFGAADPGEGAPEYYLDITNEVTWTLDPANVGEVVAGLFTAVAEGTTRLAASLDGLSSDATEIRVVAEPTVVALTIYPEQSGFIPVRPLPLVGATGAGFVDPCFECGYTITVLRGDELRFHATARYDTGEWRDVTAEVAWRSSEPSVASIDGRGVMRAITAGTAVVDATLEGIASNPVTTRVVNEATLEHLYVYQEGPQDRAVIQGGQLFFRAVGVYDIGFQRDVTAEALWRSADETVGGFDTPGAFIGRGAGNTRVWAEIGGLRSEAIDLQVFVTSDITYCDPANVNRGVWSDAFNRVVLESDCAEYTQPGVVTLRYTVTESQRPGGIFDPCLDLYVYAGGTKVRTLREEGCGEPFLVRSAPEFDAALPRYQLQAFWDLKDERGQPVPPGTYTIFGRFYLYYDPVVTIQVTVR